ncbi:unnamed protein product [Clonostachys rhizophaga]|uniref:Major facilitator superfamily (MFS) profile domain-containing protein n=1 Tax=Clonostachys rhizophaga TaxID=160324 RepID=A0A9N9YPX0_9HYPO|nr:unnamed protein product [Clonostachys rhizophaga]
MSGPEKAPQTTVEPVMADSVQPEEALQDTPTQKNASEKSGDLLETTMETSAEEDLPPKGKTLGFQMSVLALVIMAFIVSLDGTILAVAIPTIVHTLHGTTLEAFWASISFVLAVVITQPLYTNVSNVLGRTIPLHISFVLFMAGSIIFALAQSMAVLIAGRVVQGLGAGGLDVFNEIILADITTLKERPKYLGLMAIPVAAGSIIGPIIGGLLADNGSWRWIGWINLPVCVLNILLVVFFLKLQPLQDSLSKKFSQLDLIGLGLFTVGCTLTATPIAWAGAMYPWSSWRTLVPLLLGVVVLVVFWWYESKPEEPVFPRSVFATLTACFTLITTFIHGILVYSTIFYAPLFFQSVFLQSAIKSAITMLPLACTSVVFGVLGAVVVEVTRKYRLIILASWIFSAVGCGIITLWDENASLGWQVGFQIVLGIGTGSLFSILNLPLQASLSNPDDMGVAAGVLVAFRLFGALLGLSICSTVFNSVFAVRMGKLGPLPDDLQILHDAREAVGFIPLLKDVTVDPEILNEVIHAYMVSLYAVFWMLAGVSVVGFILSFLIKEKSIEIAELGRQQYDGKETNAASNESK